VIVGSKGFLGSHLADGFSSHNIVAINSSKALESYLRESNNLSFSTIFIWAASRVTPYTAEYEHDLVELEFEEFVRFSNIVDASNGNCIHNFLLLSSAGCVYSAEKLPFFEDSMATGINKYGVLKIRIEDYCLKNFPNAIICRLSNVYGPGQISKGNQGVVGAWLLNSLRSDPLILFGDGSEFRDFIYVKDVVHAILRLVEQDARGIFNVGFGVATSLIELLNIFAEVLGAKVSIETSPRRRMDRSGYELNIDKLIEEVNWRPEVSLQTGLRLTWKYMSGSN
jgi:UDP-glucose 4-epimerase